MDIGTMLQNLRTDGTIADITRNPLAQFGTRTRRYIGAELLPEKTVTENIFREEQIRYRTIVANDGSRYSPVQRKRGELLGSFEVELGDSDIGRQLSGREYDTLLKILGIPSGNGQTAQGVPMAAITQIINWVDTVLVRALVELCEVQRWQALINAQVIRKGHNGFTETINYVNPSGHRVNAAGTWSNNSYDPYADITAIVNLLHGKGYTVSRIITRRPVITILSQNTLVRQRVGITTIAPNVLAGVSPGFVNIQALNTVLARDGLPPFEEYNLQYRTQAGSAYFLPGNTVVFVCQTGRDETLDIGDAQRFVTDTLGYLAIGRAVGESEPGRVVKLFPYEDKPPRIDGQAWQCTLPVITEPEAVAVILNIS